MISNEALNKIKKFAEDEDIKVSNVCREFCVLKSDIIEFNNFLFLRYLTIDVSIPEKPMQCYHYTCFDLDGNVVDCDIKERTKGNSNEFFWSLKEVSKIK